MGFFVDFQNDASNLLSVRDDAVCFTVGCIDAVLNRFAGDDFSIITDMIVALAELHHGAVFESPLIVENKLLAVAFFKRK